MRLEEQLAALLADLGVVMEESDEERTLAKDTEHEKPRARARYSYGASREREDEDAPATEDDLNELEASIMAQADISLFQTSREHYGVFYRLDLTEGAPQLRVFLPEDEGGVKMRCYFVRAATGTPLHEWFITAREHEGSPAYEDARDAAHQHLLFAAGELMKRLFWSGDLELMRFPAEIEVVRLM